MISIYTETVFPCNTILDIPHSFSKCENIPMGYLDKLSEIRKRRGLTQGQLAELVDVEQPTVQRWEQGKREPDIGKLHDLTRVLGVTVGELLGGAEYQTLGPQLFVKGEVAAGIWKTAVEWDHDDWKTFTGRNDVAADMEHRFGLRLIGDSMNELYPDGTIVECVSLFGRAEAMPGKRVVVVRQNDNNEYEATVKELVEQDGELWLVPRSYNPAHTPFKLNDPQPGIIETRITAVVVSSVRPE